MYLRTIQRINQDGSVVRYLQLAHNVRPPGKRHPQAEVVYSFGREDQLDRAALGRLVRSISRFLDPDQALAATAASELRFTGSRPFGGAFVLDALWQRLGLADAIARAQGTRKLDPKVERVLFCLVANRALDPMSKLGVLSWAAGDVALPRVGALGEDPQVFYRAMDFLLEADEPIQREVFFAVANLLNLEVDVILFDTTSTYFETEDDDPFRRYGHSKDHRDDRPQVVVGLAVTKQGIPVRCWSFAGNASDKTVIRQVHDDLNGWKLHRVLWVGDSGFASDENRQYLQRSGGHVLVGEKLRQGSDNAAALARPGRYQPVAENLKVKQVWVGDGVGRRRFVVCRNLAEAHHDQARRERALARLDDELAAIGRKQGDARGGRLVVDQAKVRADARLDGKWLLSCTDDAVGAADLAVLYKQLIEVERSWRDLKHVLDLRPVYHRKQERIRAHITLCFLALVLVRVAETSTGATWPTIRQELERMHLGEFAGPAGRLTQRTETTPRQRELLRALEIREPPLVFDLQAARPRRRRAQAAL
jgi:Transposase DDE domain